MITPDQERYILAHAYVPEHVVGLMALVSRGEPFLVDDYVAFAKDPWVILVGYPLTRDFAQDDFARVIAETIKSFRPAYLWFIAPEVPLSVMPRCQDRESDRYYLLALETFALKTDLRRVVGRASRDLTVARDRHIARGHEELIGDFLERERPSPRIEKLFLTMREYVPASPTAVVLTARDRAGDVSAFFVVELAAEKFATYVVGCHSKRHYVAGASDLLFQEMITLVREHGKEYIHLGLGVNQGIRRFKEKWGGVPGLRYEFCEYRPKDPLRFLTFGFRAWM